MSKLLNKRPCGLPLDIRPSRLHLELPYMQNVLAHGTAPRSGVVAGSLIRFLNISGRLTLRRQPRNAVQPPRKIPGSPPASSWVLSVRVTYPCHRPMVSDLEPTATLQQHWSKSSDYRDQHSGLRTINVKLSTISSTPSGPFLPPTPVLPAHLPGSLTQDDLDPDSGTGRDRVGRSSSRPEVSGSSLYGLKPPYPSHRSQKKTIDRLQHIKASVMGLCSLNVLTNPSTCTHAASRSRSR